MGSRSKQLLWFVAGVAVGFAAASIDEILMLVARRPSPVDADAAEPALRLDVEEQAIRSTT